MEERGIAQRQRIHAEDVRVDDSLANRFCNRIRDEDHPDEVTDRGHRDRLRRREDLRRDDCRDRVRRVVKPVEEVEQEDNEDRDRDYREEIRHSESVPPLVPPRARERSPTPHWFFATMSLRTLATSSQWSVAASRTSVISLNLMIVTGSSERKSAATALFMRSSATFSRRWTSMAIRSTPSACFMLRIIPTASLRSRVPSLITFPSCTIASVGRLIS